MKAGFIGAGKVGFSLGKYLAENGIDVTGYYSRSADSAIKASEFTGTRYYKDLTDIIEDSDTLFITAPDGAITEVWEYIRNLPIKNKNICHCSGSISSAAFFDAEKKGAFRYSIHPLYAFSDRYESYKDLRGAYFSIEGSKARLKEMTACFAQLGNTVVPIDQEAKALYHCAAVMASNHMIALADAAAEMLSSCGFDQESAVKALTPLMRGNISAIIASGPAAALTGPVERNDLNTVAEHLHALERADPQTAELYRFLSSRLVKIACDKHPDRDYTELKELLTDERKSLKGERQ